MNTFTIKDIEHLSGIKAHTIRIWEQRYALIQPKRKDTNHRYYDCEDLKKILRIAYLYHNGYKISRIASMEDDEIQQLTLGERKDNHHYYEVHINQMMEAMIDFDQLRFEKIFHNILLHIGFEQCITQVVYPYLERVGLLWMTGNIIPAQEHFSSNLIRKKMMVAIDGLELTRHPETHFLLFLPEGEFHEIPLLFVQYLLKKNGRFVTNFGANVPLEDLHYYMKNRPVSHLYTHMITNFTHLSCDKYIQKLHENFPATRIIVSGPQCQYLKKALPANVMLLRSLEEIMLFAKG